MMIKKTLYLLFTTILLVSCASYKENKFVSRIEEDKFEITEIDTSFLHQVENSPENIDRGIIFPSDRELIVTRNKAQRDSVVKRYYPNFIRLGLFETVGVITGQSHKSLDPGFLGAFPSVSSQRNEAMISGGMYRLGIFESRLRWFKDSPDWTIGTSAFEAFLPNADFDHQMFSVLPIYVRKRYYFKEDIPYLALTLSAGLSWAPTQYANLSASLDLGSIGGLNLRTYVGLIAGQNSFNTNENAPGALVYPYLGFGASVLDFHNRVPELETEWKDHEHSSWNVGLLQVALVGSSGGGRSTFLTTNDENQNMPPEEDNALIDGMIVRIANASVALPFIDERLYAGTSLGNIVVPNFDNAGIGILPIRVGWWQTLIEDELSLEPFVEYNYYPSAFYHIGARANIELLKHINVSVWMGYANGSKLKDLNTEVFDDLSTFNEINTFYFGIGLGLIEEIFTSKELRYNR